MRACRVLMLALFGLLACEYWSVAQEAIKRDPHPRGPTADQRLAQEHHKKGVELMRAEHFDEAIVELRQAIRLDPDLVMAHYDLGQALMAVREYPPAVKAYTDCRDAWQRFADRLQKGDFEADAIREDRLRELRDRVRDLQRTPAAPGSPQATRIQNEITRTESLMSSLDTTRTRGKERLDLPAELSLALGSAYFRSGQLEDAEREYKAAVAVQPKLGQAHSNLAVLYLMLHRPAEASEAVKRAEKAGFRVSSELKKDIEAALKGPSS